MNRSEYGLPGFGTDDAAVERELHDVAGLDAHRRARARHQKMAGVVRMADRYVAERIDDIIGGENPVRGDEVFL